MKQFSDIDTIIAISTTNGVALRSIIRLSGHRAWEISRQLFSELSAEASSPRESIVISLNIDQNCGLNLAILFQFWPAGRSYTCQELIELHLPTPNSIGQIVVNSLVEKGARPAHPGEFSLRAFLSGRIDLTRAEAVAGLFQATSQAQLEVAFDQLAGGLMNRLEKLRARLLDLLAWLEATLDFVEESDVSPIARNLTAEELRGSALELDAMSRQWEERTETGKTMRVLLSGPPNAGKSSLFNALTKSGLSLVSPVAGTTRDYLEAILDLGNGLKITLVDTAGLGKSIGLIDHNAQQIARREQLMADLLIDCRAWDQIPTENETPDYPTEIPVISIRTKTDKASENTDTISELLNVSSFTGEGIAALKCKIASRLQGNESSGQLLESTRARARDSLVSASEALKQASATITNNGGDELVAMDLRTAVESLDLITGRDVSEEMLDRIFSRFCIGK